VEVKRKLLCTFENFQSLSEEVFVNSNVVFSTVSLIFKNYELMIFIDNDVKKGRYNVCIYKDKVNETHIPHVEDDAIGYYETEEYTTIFFTDFNLVKKFMAKLAYNHKEYQKRPIRRISSN